MTYSVFKTNLEEIEKVKLACKCGFSAEYPVSAISGILENCPSCCKKTPIVSFMEFLKAISAMKSTLKHFPDCQVQIETEEKND